MKKNIFTEEQENNICTEFKNGKSAAELSRQYDQHKFRIYEVLKRNGLKPKDNHRTGPRGQSEERKQEIVDFYQSPSSILQTAKKFNMSYGAIRKILGRKGVLRLDRGQKSVSDEVLKDMVDKWNDDWSQTAIAKHHHISQAAVGRLLWKEGIKTSKRRPVGKDHGSYKSGRYIENGYCVILISKDHKFYKEMAMKHGYVMEHRLIMAEYLNRPLSRNETVHHINGNRQDNRIENLQLRTSNHGAGAKFICCECGSHNVQAIEL